MFRCEWGIMYIATTSQPQLFRYHKIYSKPKNECGLSCYAIGHYMYIEVSSPIKTGQKARVLSEDFPSTRRRCVNFWFHMFGATVGTLNLYVKTGLGNSTKSEQLIWSLSGNFGNQWMNGQAPISSTARYQVSTIRLFWAGTPVFKIRCHLQNTKW